MLAEEHQRLCIIFLGGRVASSLALEADTATSLGRSEDCDWGVLEVVLGITVRLRLRVWAALYLSSLFISPFLMI